MAVYLDCAATTPVDPRVADFVMHSLRDECGNAGSRTHGFGAAAKRAVEHARDQVAAVAGCSRGEVFFTSGATEANNLAILGLANHGRATGRMHLVCSAIEHNAVLEPLAELERRGFELTVVRPNTGGWVEAESIARALRKDTLLVCVMQANNETGVLQPIGEIANVLAEHPAFFLVDAAQGFGKEIESLQNRRIDLVSISGHKIHAPQGVGALISRRRNGQRPPLNPIMFGGGQERGLRPGTLPVHLIVGLGLAAELAAGELGQRIEVNRAFRERALAALTPLSPVMTGDAARALPHILNVTVPGVDAEAAMEALAEVIAISNGSACTSGQEVCSHVLSAMGFDERRAEGALRLSWCHLTPEPDWSRVVAILMRLRDQGEV